ncbi:calcineurin-like phosphoesterase superfamily domain protein [Geobacter sp. OR-1]|uniref:metallophosphoesterase family protein n=1 Tax=Geobacter sp. OR-1 TaxID=1266765 RepID=UPI000543CFFF|nr:metallophosphoesterase [Geobacter sp. OR-1]GAM10473.1 calcineurin-like phosphoesterase superfamily domain protein [Geobacter sp. OR-1]
MKILVAGDLHFNKTQFQWLADQKSSYDCLCLTGDFLDSTSDDFIRQAEWVANWMQELGVQIFICSGNHDLDPLAECGWLSNLRSKKICRDNQKKLFNGIRFGCVPYLGANYHQFSDCDVLLTHVPPRNSATAQSVVSGKTADWGDEELYRALAEGSLRPRYILCGHVEKPSSTRDCLLGIEIINPGAQHGSAVPAHEILFV